MSNYQVKNISFTKYNNEETGWPTNRIIISLSDNAKFDAFQLNGPPRVVVDIKGASLDINGNEVFVNDGIVNKIRWSQFQSDIVRVVIDLDIQGRCDIYHSLPEKGDGKIQDQLIIDIQGFYLNVWDHINKIIVTQNLNDYLMGVVAAEMPASFNKEALKSQAVIARTNLFWASKILGGEGLPGIEDADISSDPGIIQGWISEEKMKEKWGSDYNKYSQIIKGAVKETENQVLVYNQELIKALFHSTCGGGTLSSEEVWGESIPYLVNQSCNYCQFSPYWNANKVINIKDFIGKLVLDNSFPFKPEYSKGGMLKSANLDGKTFSGSDLRSKLLLNSYKINFSIDKVTVNTKGFGHGVGLCQYGAEGLARSGKNYQDILKYYYSGVALINKDIVPKTQISDEQPPLYDITEIKNIRFGIHIDEDTKVQESRIVIEASQAVRYKIKHNETPAYIEILLEDSKLSMGEGNIPVEGDLVKSINKSQSNSNEVKVTVNLLTNVKVDIFNLGENISDSPVVPYRIVIDLQGISSTKPNTPPEASQPGQPTTPPTSTKPPQPKPPTPESKPQPKPTTQPTQTGQPLKGKIIVLDPGHGGKDSGAIGIKGLQEKDVVLTIGMRLKELLQAAGAKVVMTRSTNIFIPLQGRTNLANKENADIFVAIHNNSAAADSGRGLETYYHAGSKKGMELAADIQKRLVEGLGWPDRKIKTAGFYVIRNTNMPSCLVEVGFVSNPTEGSWLALVNNRYKAAALIYQGILDYFK